MKLNEENENPIKSETEHESRKDNKKKEKKSFWKDKKNVAIVVLIFLLICVCTTDNKEKINDLIEEKGKLENQVAVLENEKVELTNQFNSNKDEDKEQLRNEIGRASCRERVCEYV